MKTRVSLALIGAQALLAYAVFPNRLVYAINPFSAVLVFLLPVVFCWMVLWYRGKMAFLMSGLSGVAMFLPPVFFMVSMSYFPVIGPLLWLFIAGLAFVLVGGLGVALSAIIRKYPAAYLIILPVGFETFEFLRTWLSPHVWFIPLPGAMLAYPLAGLPPLIQMASLTGVFGPEMLVIAIGAILALISWLWLSGKPLLKKWLGRDEAALAALPAVPRGKALSLGTILILALAALTAAGNMDAWRIARVQAETKKTLRPAMLQGNMDAALLGRSAKARNAFLDIYRGLILDAARQKADVLIFTEDAFPGSLPYHKKTWDQLRDVFKEVNLPAVIGVITNINPKISYSLWYEVAPSGAFLNHYVKQYLLPFGEYLPARMFFDGATRMYNVFANRTYRVLKLTAVAEEDRDLTRGSEEKVFRLGDKAFFLNICEELMFSKFFRQGVRLGGEFAISPATGNWFQTPEYWNHYLEIACFRAVETRRWIGRVVNMAGSAFIDPLGRVRAMTPYGRRMAHVYTVPLLDGQTLYVRFGDWLGWLCVLALAVLGLGAALPRRPA